MMFSAQGAPAVRAAIAAAARQLGREDPSALARDLLEVDVDALDEWFGVAAKVQVQLWQGAGRLSDSLPLLTAGWSSPAPRLRVTDQRDAGRSSRDIIGPQVDAADRAAAILRQGRLLADGALSQADSGVFGLGWDSSTELLTWAADNDQLAAVSAIVGGLVDRLDELRERSSDALRELATSLHHDPRDPVELLTRGTVAPGGAPGQGGQPPTAGADAPGFDSSVDQHNRTQLEADLRSADAPTAAMAIGVMAALEKARTEGGAAQLLVYESANSSSQGRAAIGLGDITSADNIAVMAPGISNSPFDMAGGIDGAMALRAAAAEQSPGDSTAVVAWYGYDIPLSAVSGVPMGPVTTAVNAAASLSDSNARAGGALLVNDLAQMRQWAPSSTRFVGIGFSMGSTTISAAAALGAGFDDVVLMGSPGASTMVRSADDYPGMSPDHAFVTAFDQDPVTSDGVDLLAALARGLVPPPLGPYGPDPADADFGAQVIDVESNAPDVAVSLPGLGGLLSAGLANTVFDTAAHHSEMNYLSGPSLQALADITVGRYSEVPIKPGR
jgi:hypothetical protein